MLKRTVMTSLLAVLFSATAMANGTGLHLVLLKGKGAEAKFTAKVESLGGDVEFLHKKAGVAFVSGLDEADVAALAGSSLVQAIEPDQVFELDDQLELEAPQAIDAALKDAAGGAFPELVDPTTAFFYARQWHLRAIDADLAWAAGRQGSPAVTVAILDTGIAYTHPDLQGRVDLARSASFVPADDALVDLVFPGLHHITDLHYHGTHVAATVASNAVAAAGVTSETTLIGVKVCSVFGGCPGSAIIQGLLHAVDNGADVANMSLGGVFSKSQEDARGYVGFLHRLFNYVQSQGMTVVVSAGNSAFDLDHDGNEYKTYCSTPSTVCVSATGPYSGGADGPWSDVDELAGYSNYGRSAVDVAAPGGNTSNPVSSQRSFVRAACSNTCLITGLTICQTGTFVLGVAGTSMASPHVSGVAALVVEDVGRNPGRVKTVLQGSADDLGLPGVDPAYGKGRLNAFKASQ